jgi:hypothetical protein
MLNQAIFTRSDEFPSENSIRLETNAPDWTPQLSSVANPKAYRFLPAMRQDKVPRRSQSQGEQEGVHPLLWSAQILQEPDGVVDYIAMYGVLSSGSTNRDVSTYPETTA